MRLLLAPIHGVTLAYYRNLHKKYIGGFDEYHAPFIVTTDDRQSSSLLFKDVHKEMNNDDVVVIPQLLSNNGDHFLNYGNKLVELGYDKVNWNIGCPFPVVTKKLRGSGIMQYPEMVDKFLDKVFSGANFKVTAKMRLGYEDLDEGIEVMKVLNKYPLAGLTIHGRTGLQKYEGRVDLDAFDVLFALSKHVVTYNGDIYTPEDLTYVRDRYPTINDFMLGRGAMRNPLLPLIINDSQLTEAQLLEKFINFHDSVVAHFSSRPSTEKALVDKLKSFWTYTADLIDPDQIYINDLRRVQTRYAYDTITDRMITNSNVKFRESVKKGFK